MFKLRDRSPANVAATAAVLRSMDGRIPALRHIEVATDQRHSPTAYDIALITRFDSWEAYDIYRTDPYHVDPVLAHMSTVADHAATVDFESD